MTELKSKVNNLIKSSSAKRLSSKVLFKGGFISVVEECYQLPNNNIIKKERIIKNNGKESVIIIPKTVDDKYILVAQTRINEITNLEFPSGYVENNETLVEAASRELLEETGYVSLDIKQIDTCYSQVGIDGSVINIMVAYDCVKMHDQSLSNNEYINYDEFTFDELQKFVKSNFIKSTGNKLAFYELKEQLKRI